MPQSSIRGKHNGSLLQRYVLLDIETTGVDPVNERINDIALPRIEAGAVVARWQSLVDPQQSTPQFVRRMTGITGASRHSAGTSDARCGFSARAPEATG